MIDTKDNEILPEQEANEQSPAQAQSNELQTCQQQLAEWKDRCLRAIAEFENLKKRTEKDRASWIFTTQSQMLRSIIDILDDFDRAFASLSCVPQDETNKQWLSGFTFIHQSLKKLLAQYGAEEMSEYKIFDPMFHEALMQVESAEHQSGQIVQVLAKGYMFKGNVLRPAKVSVAK